MRVVYPPIWRRTVHSQWKVVLLTVLALAATGCSITGEPWGCGMGAACPALAEVGSVRYSISGSQDLIDVEKDLTPFGSITQTNVDEYFTELTVFAIRDIDPAAVLVARSAPQAQDDSGPYRLMFAFRSDTDSAWPALCQYMTADRQDAQPECGPGTTP